MKKPFYLVILAVFVIARSFGADSESVLTSGWLKVGSAPAFDSNVVSKGIPNRTYLSVQLESSVIRNVDSWWTSFIKSGDKAGLIATVKADGLPDQTALSTMVRVDNNKEFQFSTNRVLVEKQPLGRSRIEVRVQMIATSEDGVAKLINELSPLLPAAGVATGPAIMATVGIGKGLVDALFGKNLLKTSLDSTYTMGELESGYYVIFAANKKSDYDTVGANDLAWNNGILKRVSGQPIPAKASYFIVKVTHLLRKYPSPESVLDDSALPWAKLFREMNSKIVRPWFVPTPEKVAKEKARLAEIDNALVPLADQAVLLIQLDPSLTQAEKDEIAQPGRMMQVFFAGKIVAEIKRLEDELKEASIATLGTNAERQDAGRSLAEIQSFRGKSNSNRILSSHVSPR